MPEETTSHDAPPHPAADSGALSEGGPAGLPFPGQPGDPQEGLLQQMEDLLEALTADLSQLDADLQPSALRGRGTVGDAPPTS